jgi:hypothetical protein
VRKFKGRIAWCKPGDATPTFNYFQLARRDVIDRVIEIPDVTPIWTEKPETVPRVPMAIHTMV